MAKSVINSSSKQDAIKSCTQFLAYFPFRYAAIVEFRNGTYGYVTGKTKARMNTLARKGYKVFFVTQSK